MNTPIDPELIELGELPLDSPAIHEGPARKVESTRSRLAFLILALLAGTIGFMLVLLYQGKLTTEEFASVAGVLISPIVGLLGAATGYYYGRADRNS